MVGSLRLEAFVEEVGAVLEDVGRFMELDLGSEGVEIRFERFRHWDG